MADGLEGALTTKIGPLPLWGYLAAGGAGVVGFILWQRGRGVASGSPTAAAAGAPGTSPYAPSPIVISPQVSPLMSSSPDNPPTTPPAPTKPGGGTIFAKSIWGPRAGAPVWLFAAPDDSTMAGSVPAGTQLTTAGDPVQGGAHTAGSPAITSAAWVPIQYAGGTFYVWGPEASGQGTSGSGGLGAGLDGLGGAGDSLALFGDGRHANPATSLIPPLAHQSVMTAGMGGGGGHRNAAGVSGRTLRSHAGGLAAVRGRTGAPMIRLLALNPGHWRPGTGQNPNYARVR